MSWLVTAAFIKKRRVCPFFLFLYIYGVMVCGIYNEVNQMLQATVAW
jgi:hypothetical protein